MSAAAFFRYPRLISQLEENAVNHRAFTIMVILVTFAASLVFGGLFVFDYLDGGRFFLCMIATVPALLVFRSVYAYFFCKNSEKEELE